MVVGYVRSMMRADQFVCRPRLGSDAAICTCPRSPAGLDLIPFISSGSKLHLCRKYANMAGCVGVQAKVILTHASHEQPVGSESTAFSLVAF